jgi:hypothetical protein
MDRISNDLLIRVRHTAQNPVNFQFKRLDNPSTKRNMLTERELSLKGNLMK